MKYLWRIIKFTSSLKRYYLAISVMTILLAIMSQLVPLFTKAAIDQVTKNGGQTNVGLVALYAFLIFLTDIGQSLFSNISGYWGDILSVKLRQFMSNKYYEHLLSLPQRYFDTELTGTIINRMNRGIQDISDFIQVFSNNFLQFIFSTIFTLAIVAYYAWPVALMLAMLYPIFIWMTAKTSHKWQFYQRKINQDIDIASGRFAESIGQVRVVKSFIQEARELKFFDQQFRKATKTVTPQSRYWHERDNLRRTILSVIFFFVFVFIFVETARGRYSVGTMVLLIQYSMLIRIPIFSISFLVDRTQRAVANSKEYFEVMEQQPDFTDKPGAMKLKVKEGRIDFDNVSFSYDLKQPVLKNINLAIAPDTKVALVGESGEGKTTLTNLLLRFYEPEKGQILIDDQNINDVTQASLRQQIGVVFQDSALFSGTIKENICYAKPSVTDDQLLAAAKAANAHEFIEKLPNGYDTEIGERGLKLSGGQKQRIAIARAILKDAPILVLDEATSSLDSKSENMVQQALERLMRGRTTIIIAHRLSTIQNVDQIITIRNGCIDEVGTPSKLAHSGGIYDQLLKLQHGQTETTKKKLKEFEIAA
ncbi:ABC transporter ATP-binding protein [Candidatus Saccharibacteria bacterium]|nr:ABC transporter ATP-binding protein [Candidatus Saccharibacteria bacterium]MBI3338068.1 ABC transporter ATP-binding protein [Candidatus Saccharibacteria bacterium]